MPSLDTDRTTRYAIAVVAVLTLLYSVLITQTILAWFGIAIPLVLLYLVWRFVRAHERIADALEGRAGIGDSTGARNEDEAIGIRDRQSGEDEDADVAEHEDADDDRAESGVEDEHDDEEDSGR